jgi:hypothetical protein
MLFFYSLEFSHFVKSSLFIYFCISRDLHQQKIPRELCGWGDPLYFYFPMERFFDGTDQENSKPQGRKAQIRKMKKNKMERMEERKRRDFYIHGGSHTHLFCIGWQHQRLPPLCNRPSGEPTHMGTSPTSLNCC